MFGPAWTLIFGLCAMSAVDGVDGGARRETLRDVVLGLFAINGFLNLLWSFLFFRMQRPDLAAIEVWFLWASMALLIVICWRFSRTGGAAAGALSGLGDLCGCAQYRDRAVERAVLNPAASADQRARRGENPPRPPGADSGQARVFR